jgi:uncharacterized protein
MPNPDQGLDLLRETITGFLSEEHAKIVLFGSRARGEQNPASDVDIGILHHGEIDRGKLSLLREKIEELNIPYKVEIVDLSETSEDFRKQALKDGVIWKDCA